MGYESKIIVVDRHEHESKNGLSAWVYGGELARFDLSKMGHDRFDGVMFRDLFTIPIDFDLYVRESPDDVPDNFYRVDCYDEYCKYTTDIDRVITWLEKFDKVEHYRRASLFRDFLRVLKEHKDEYNEICLVHYGY